MIFADFVLVAKLVLLVAFKPYLDKVDNLVQVGATIASLAAVNVNYFIETMGMPSIAADISSVVIITVFGLALAGAVGMMIYVLITTPDSALRFVGRGFWVVSSVDYYCCVFCL